jgi:hypothetical protein
MRLIGLCGKAGSGKDTVGEILHHNYGYTRMAFADKVKQVASVLWGINITEFYDIAYKNEVAPLWGMTRRAMLQAAGEMVKTHINTDFWVESVCNNLESDSRVVVTDVRFDREAERLIELGGVIIEVARNGAGLSGAEAAHVSEKGISVSLIHHRLQNHGTLHHLEQGVVELMRKIEDAQ